MADNHLVIGRYTYNIDKKNRLFLPAKHREAMGPEVVVGPSFKDLSLTVFSSDDFNNILLKAEALDPEEKDDFIDQFVSLCDSFKPDDQGRITLTVDLVKYANLSESVVIQGIGHRAKIWSQEGFQQKTQQKHRHTLSELSDKIKA